MTDFRYRRQLSTHVEGGPYDMFPPGTHPTIKYGQIAPLPNYGTVNPGPTPSDFPSAVTADYPLNGQHVNHIGTLGLNGCGAYT